VIQRCNLCADQAPTVKNGIAQARRAGVDDGDARLQSASIRPGHRMEPPVGWLRKRGRTRFVSPVVEILTRVSIRAAHDRRSTHTAQIGYAGLDSSRPRTMPDQRAP
jgi:hypothetical protein